LPGFGEKRTASIEGRQGQPVQVTYQFDRYQPFMLVEGSDGTDYHIQVSPRDGAVVKVLGMRAPTRSLMSFDSAFQPYGSEYAFKFGEKGVISEVYEEGPPGTYRKLTARDKSMSEIVPPCF
jgi:hypothetical protein